MIKVKTFLVFSIVLCLCVNCVVIDDDELVKICDVCSCEKNTVNCVEKEVTGPLSEDQWTNVTIQALQVDLSQNRLGSVAKFPLLPIQSLNLSSCQIDSLEDECFTNLADLMTLDLSNNMLATSAVKRRVFMGPFTPGQPPKSFKKMRTLSLSRNDIHSLPRDIFIFMSQLASLDVSGNPLAYIDQVTMAAISELVSLKELNLNSCELEALPEGLLRRQRKLERLDLSNNRFTTVPSVLQETVSLVYLNLGKNPIESIDDTTSLTKLTTLQDLRLCRLSKLQSIGAKALSGLDNLKTLHICHNPRLTNLDQKFLVSTDDQDVDRWPELSELRLNKNNLSVIYPSYLGSWDQLTDIDVTNNPYVCDCSVQWMVNVLVPLVQELMGNASQLHMTCKFPPDLSGLTFRYLLDSQKELFCKPENLVNVADANGIILLGVMIGMIVAFPLILVVVLSWKKGYFGRCQGRFNSRHSVGDEYEKEEF